MNIKVKKLSGKMRINLLGELLLSDAVTLKAKFLNILASKTKTEMDLSQVNEIDTACFQILVQLKQECIADNLEFSILDMSKSARETIKLYGMENFFDNNPL